MNAIYDGYDFGGLNTHLYPFDKLHDAFDTAIHKKAEALKVMLDFKI
jgi:threonine dehydrogenase-like Zn-dependent dehydrogenase